MWQIGTRRLHFILIAVGGVNFLTLSGTND
jgi:hypothetical protein